MAVSRLFGKVPVEKDRLINMEIGVDISVLISDKTLGGIL